MPTDGTAAPQIDLAELQAELEGVASEALKARRSGLSLLEAVRDPRYPGLTAFHQDIRDALFVEIPQEFEPWARAAASSRGESGFDSNRLQRTLFSFARAGGDDELSALQAALAELLVFEAVRLRLLVTALGSDEFEVLGGEESDVDAIAWSEIRALIHLDALADPEVRPLTLILAAANVALARDTAERAEVLRTSGDDFREELREAARKRRLF